MINWLQTRLSRREAGAEASIDRAMRALLGDTCPSCSRDVAGHRRFVLGQCRVDADATTGRCAELQQKFREQDWAAIDAFADPFDPELDFLQVYVLDCPGHDVVAYLVMSVAEMWSDDRVLVQTVVSRSAFADLMDGRDWHVFRSRE